MTFFECLWWSVWAVAIAAAVYSLICFDEGWKVTLIVGIVLASVAGCIYHLSRAARFFANG